MTLPDPVSAGQSGHLSHHNELHGLVNDGAWVPSPSSGFVGQDAQFPTTKTVNIEPSTLIFVNHAYTGDDGTRVYICPSARPTADVGNTTGGFLKIFSDPFHEQTELDHDYMDFGIGYSRAFAGDEGYNGVGFMVLNVKANGPSYDEVHKWADIWIGFQDGAYPAGRIVFHRDAPTHSIWVIGERESQAIDESSASLLEVQGGIVITGNQFGNNREIRWQDDFAGNSYRNTLAFTDTAMTCTLDGIQALKAKGSSVVIGPVNALATTATVGFLEIPTCAGTPTGTPTPDTGKVPIVYDTTNHKICVYEGGAWKKTAALT